MRKPERGFKATTGIDDLLQGGGSKGEPKRRG